ncbi:MAG: HEAT repeat domain-containing protein [Ktedonobacteraceae bacterium]|nr:HEAT repeat domain-containing protein [Ktedonobacteraceae bacterium]
MSDMDMEQSDPTNPQDSGATEQGLLHIEEAQDETTQEPIVSGPVPDVKPATPLSAQALERAGTVEHLAARRSLPPLDANTPEIKERLTALRIDMTRLITSYRWEGLSVEATATQMIPLLNVGPVQQWHPILIPFLLEIDRAGNLIPVWLHIIEKGDPSDLPPDANPAETVEGRARRFALLMLGNYRFSTLLEQNKSKALFSDWPTANNTKSADLLTVLGELATDPNSSLYATHSLAKLGTAQATQALITALRTAEGWAKVDIIEACLTLNQPRFYDLLVASGLDRVPGLESYVAIPIYRTIPLENYLRSDTKVSDRLTQQAALIVGQVLQDSATPPTDGKTLPPVFQRDLSVLANILFENARKTPTWQNVLAIHRLATLLGRYWADISRQAIQDTRIIDPIYACVPMMPEVERWMAGPGRDVLLETLTNDDDQAFTPVVKVLGELREPRATSLLLTRIEATKELTNREQGRAVAAATDALGRLGDRRATLPIIQLVNRVVDVERRTSHPKRRDNLPPGDADIPGSVIYASAVRTCGLLGDRNALDMVLRAANDFDPYVRIQALEALKSLDASGEDFRSRSTAREALNDPRDTVARIACQLVLQYRDADAHPALRRVIETRPELAALAYDTLRQLGQ